MKTIIFKVFLLAILSVSFLGCSSDDPPQNLITDCPEGFTGPNCDIPINPEPSAIKIRKVEVVEFPSLDPATGINWDGPGLKPDLSLTIKKGANIVFDSSTYFQNAENGLVYYFEITPNINSTNISDIFSIELWDYDLEDIPSNSNDFMGGIYFSPYVENENPSSVLVTSGGLTLRVYLSYEW